MKPKTLKICVCDYVEVRDGKLTYTTFSCTQNNKWMIIKSPEFYSPASTYWTPTMARAPSLSTSTLSSNQWHFA